MERYRIIPHTQGIQIVIPHEFTRLLGVITPSAQIVVQKARETRNVYIDEGARWGFGGALTRRETSEGTIFIVELFSPGSRGILFAHSLNVLCLALRGDDPHPIYPDPQDPLIALDGLLSENGPSGHDMGATLSHAMLEVLPKFTRSDQERVVQAMLRVANMLTPRVRYPFRCSTERGLSLVVPGEATYLARHGSEGELRGHNIDNYWQQAMLLVGLAEVQAIAEEKIASS